MNPEKTLRYRVYEIIDEPREHHGWAQRFNVFMCILIIANISVVILESVKSINAEFGNFLSAFDTISVLIFTIEYILRLWTCTCNPKFHKPVIGRLGYAATPLAIFDLIAILPFYLPMIIPLDLRMLRVLRLMRILRILKLGRYSEAVKTFERVLHKKKEEILLAFGILFIVLIMASCLMYSVESDVQPDKFPDIPHAMWWGIVTLATVGYGDVDPITPLGKLLGGAVLVTGIAVFALPTGIFAAGFVEVIEEKKPKYFLCPHCGKHHDHHGNKIHSHEKMQELVEEKPEK